MTSYGKKRVELVFQPVSGKALPVYKGELLRITQLGNAQCVDFNCFNLHDYKEYMCAGFMRMQGFRIKKGHFVWSNPPHYRPMMVILEMPETCVTDLLHARCNAPLYEEYFGIETHTNCQDTFAECIGEYGLTPDDVHDSFNMWMDTGWNDQGITQIRRNTGKKGDYVDLMAIMDVLAVPVVCGSGDVMPTANFFPKPIKIEVFEPSDETNALVLEYVHKYSSLKNQRTWANYRVKEIRTERELKPVPGYKPNFINFPMKFYDMEVELTDEDFKNIERLRLEGQDDEEVFREAVMQWYFNNRTLTTFLGPRR